MIIIGDNVYLKCFCVFLKITYIAEITSLTKYVDKTGSRDLKAILASSGYLFLTVFQNEVCCGIFKKFIVIPLLIVLAIDPVKL